MKIERFEIEKIPSILWGENSDKIFIACHGNISNKEDEVIKILAKKVVESGYQCLSFDLPEHGERKNNHSYLCNAQNAVRDFKKIMKYVSGKYSSINLFACSMSAYFSLIAYKDEIIDKCLFLSPIVDMKLLIDNMMYYASVSKEEFKFKKEIKTEFGQTLYYDYYMYVINNPVINCFNNTSILYGAKDNMQDENTIKNFCNKFNCSLLSLQDGEHFFHTKEQISFYKNWLSDIFENKIDKNILFKNLDKIHTTELGEIRIRKNLDIKINDTKKWCIDLINDINSNIIKKGKNWYIINNDIKITINSYSYTIITAHKV